MDQPSRLTRVPALIWEPVFLLANLAGLVVGVFVLLPSVAAGAPGLLDWRQARLDATPVDRK